MLVNAVTVMVLEAMTVGNMRHHWTVTPEPDHRYVTYDGSNTEHLRWSLNTTLGKSYVKIHKRIQRYGDGLGLLWPTDHYKSLAKNLRISSRYVFIIPRSYSPE